MRIRQLIVACVPVVIALFGGTVALAQYGAPYGAGPMPGYGAYPGYSAMPGGGYPQTFQPYPMISPYDHVYDNHYQKNGLWFRNAIDGMGPLNRPHDYFFSARYIRTTTRDLHGIVGAEGVPTYAQQNDPQNDEIVAGLTSYHYFEAAPASLIPQMTNSGIRIDGGFWNPDGSGLLWNVTWNAQAKSRFDARAIEESRRIPTLTALKMRQLTNGAVDNAPFNGGDVNDQILASQILSSLTNFDTTDSIQHGFYGSTFDILDRTMFNLYSIPVLVGDNLLTVDGESVPYDMDFILEHSLQTIGGNMAWAFAPIYENNGLQIRPTVGGRYLWINEGFRFSGRGSILSYGLDIADNDTPITAKVFPPKDGIDNDGDFVIDTPDENSNSITSTTTTFAPILNTSENMIVNAYLNSRVNSSLGGPE
ncbi:MAG: hypothetical protein KDA85_01585, partial [Planctomycetaceae bacterium]|nr:hypothetical protein [Planctomycetaceae bacterium]